MLIIVLAVDIGTGRTECIPVSNNDSVTYLKRKISKLHNCSESDIDIVLKGESLKDGVILSSISVACSETIVEWVDKRRANLIELYLCLVLYSNSLYSTRYYEILFPKASSFGY